jgi:hypothetical protein
MLPIAWLERYGRTITFQQFPGSRLRAKNRVILQFADERGQVQVCGGPTLLAAIAKAQLRNRLATSTKGE